MDQRIKFQVWSLMQRRWRTCYCLTFKVKQNVEQFVGYGFKVRHDAMINPEVELMRDIIRFKDETIFYLQQRIVELEKQLDTSTPAKPDTQ
ncbi:MAG: hypothetical protein ACREHG_06125 [Candidatus Saccharimonadales bacterium]